MDQAILETPVNVRKRSFSLNNLVFGNFRIHFVAHNETHSSISNTCIHSVCACVRAQYTWLAEIEYYVHMRIHMQYSQLPRIMLFNENGVTASVWCCS